MNICNQTRQLIIARFAQVYFVPCPENIAFVAVSSFGVIGRFNGGCRALNSQWRANAPHPLHCVSNDVAKLCAESRFSPVWPVPVVELQSIAATDSRPHRLV